MIVFLFAFLGATLIYMLLLKTNILSVGGAGVLCLSNLTKDPHFIPFFKGNFWTYKKKIFLDFFFYILETFKQPRGLIMVH